MAKPQFSNNSIKGSLSGDAPGATPSTEAQPGLWAGTKVSEIRQLSIRFHDHAIFPPRVMRLQQAEMGFA
jgi:hypothetical protein